MPDPTPTLDALKAAEAEVRGIADGFRAVMDAGEYSFRSTLDAYRDAVEARTRYEVLTEAMARVGGHWNDASAMVNQKLQAERSANVLWLMRGGSNGSV